MPDLPSRGRCHATFLLAYSARVRHCVDAEAWITAALDKPTHMAASLDLNGTAELLLDVGLAKVEGGVQIMHELSKLDQAADLSTLKGIARLLIVRRPPDWLRSSVVEGQLATEFIPAQDLEALSWLGPDLDPIIVAAHQQLYGRQDDDLLKRIGDAGELMVIAALHALNRQPRHVSLVSDRFGYDIELNSQQYRFGLEIKTVVPSTADRVLLSRHEFDVAARMADRWKIVQITISSIAVVRGVVCAADVISIRELSSSALVQMAPPDTSTFQWSESAEFHPLDSMWLPSDLQVPSNFTFSLRA